MCLSEVCWGYIRVCVTVHSHVHVCGRHCSLGVHAIVQTVGFFCGGAWLVFVEQVATIKTSSVLNVTWQINELFFFILQVYGFR